MKFFRLYIMQTVRFIVLFARKFPYGAGTDRRRDSHFGAVPFALFDFFYCRLFLSNDNPFAHKFLFQFILSIFSGAKKRPSGTVREGRRGFVAKGRVTSRPSR